MSSACSSIDTDLLETHREIALTYYDSGRFLEAAGQYNKILAMDPKDTDAWIGLGNCEREVGNDLYTNATIHMENARNNADEIKVAQQEVDRAVLHHAKSREAFTKALELKPKDPAALYGLGMLYYNRGAGTFSLFTEDEQQEVDDHLRSATKCFEMVVQRVSDSYTAQRMLGLCYIATNRRREAVAPLTFYRDRMKAMETQTKTLTPNTPQDKALVDQQLLRIKKDIADTEDLIDLCHYPPDATAYDPRREGAMRLLDRGHGEAGLKLLNSVLEQALDYLHQWEAFQPADEKQTQRREVEIARIRADVAILRSAIKDAMRP